MDAHNPGAALLRVVCVVPGCRRSHDGSRYAEFCCAKHWPLTDRKLRRLMFRARRRGDRQLADRCWAKLKRQAIEHAAGL